MGFWIFMTCCTLLILWAHRGNIARLAHGQENKL